RWHLLDPVRFERSLRFTIEHKGNRPASEDAWYLERPDFLSSVAFWYQTGEPKPFEPLPPWPERRVPRPRCHLVRLLPHARSAGGAPVFVRSPGFFGGRPALVWPRAEPSGRLALPFQVDRPGRSALRLTAFTGPSSGPFEVCLDDRPLLTADLHSPSSGET